MPTRSPSSVAMMACGVGIGSDDDTMTEPVLPLAWTSPLGTCESGSGEPHTPAKVVNSTGGGALAADVAGVSGSGALSTQPRPITYTCVCDAARRPLRGTAPAPVAFGTKVATRTGSDGRGLPVALSTSTSYTLTFVSSSSELRLAMRRRPVMGAEKVNSNALGCDGRPSRGGGTTKGSSVPEGPMCSIATSRATKKLPRWNPPVPVVGRGRPACKVPVTVATVSTSQDARAVGSDASRMTTAAATVSVSAAWRRVMSSW
mmetsp:Transcript_21707/g.67409  ORF Transcript_21707/g.67409 Transcript_21707/m.67409 type:complete len:260 (+) Transcript_21707:899-1678(+)